MSTKIEWAEETWNPVVGRSKISEGCKNCYAERMATRLASIALAKGTPSALDYYVDATHYGSWSGKTSFVEEALEKPFSWKKPKRIFVCSMGDLFHETVPFEWIHQVVRIINKCPQHIFMVLTKRPERMKEFLREYSQLPYNLWLGVTAENQKEADTGWKNVERISYKTMIPLAEHKFRGISLEDNEIAHGYYAMIGKEHYILQPCVLGLFHNQVNPETVSQCTGIITLKGDDIFEGDIFRQKLEDKYEPEGFFWWKAVVRRHTNGAWVLCQVGFDYSKSPFDEYTLLIEECKKIELIGNIYQTK